jgi:hypothetical protein
VDRGRCHAERGPLDFTQPKGQLGREKLHVQARLK